LLGNLIENLLDFSRLEKRALVLTSEVFDVRAALGELRSFFAEFAHQKNVEFDLRIDDAVPAMIQSDKTRLMQVCINLAGNALKFTPAGRSVSIRVGTTASCCDRVHNEIADGPVIVVQVEDQGIGISEENVRKLFQAFYQVAKNSVEGSGLGLYICRELALLMHGHICCQSEIGRGSTFTFVCPYTPAQRVDTKPDTPEDLSEIEAVLSKRKILVAEDNRVNQLVIASMLRKLNCTFDIVDDGQAACDAFEQGDYFLILMDLMMPVMDGFEASQRISRSNMFANKKPSIVALTASVTESEIKQARSSGCIVVVSKPVNNERLREVIHAAARHYAKNKPQFAFGTRPGHVN
jgi:CheY-like chemotaxis protein